MFTGIITGLGIFIKRVKNEFAFEVPPDLAEQISEGSSVAVNGVCLTVKRKQNNTIFVDVMAETLEKTALVNLKYKGLVNLELPVTIKTLFSGHIVLGHIDAVAKLAEIRKKGDSYILKFSILSAISKYIIEKGSISINGISLTVIESANNFFTVGIIPYTWKNTMLHTLKLKDPVNIETDILGKYMEKLLK